MTRQVSQLERELLKFKVGDIVQYEQSAVSLTYPSYQIEDITDNHGKLCYVCRRLGPELYVNQQNIWKLSCEIYDELFCHAPA